MNVERSESSAGGWFSSRLLALGGLLGLVLWLALMPSTRAQAALAAFLGTALLWLWLLSRRQLEGIAAERRHAPRVFEGDALDVVLRLSRAPGRPPVQLLQVEDRFAAGIDAIPPRLIPWLNSGWDAVMHGRPRVDRHRGVYLIGPLRLCAADPLGVFVQERELDCITRLIVYPRADPLPDYTVPTEQARTGMSFNAVELVGSGEEVLGVREYRPGDPPSRVHWRTSARRGRLHVIELNRPVQSELAVLLDMSRRSRFGLGAEATHELSIRAATSILTRANETRHRFSLAYTQQEPVVFPAGAGLAQLHLLLDRLAVLEPAGELSLWRDLAPRALMLAAGARAVFIGASAQVEPGEAARLVAELVESGVGVDAVLIDERDFIRIYQDQEADAARRDGNGFEAVRRELMLAGARVWRIGRARASLAGIHPELELAERALTRQLPQ